jgi:polyisoprenoid-binding protein YceI
MTTLTAAATDTYSIDPTHSRLGFTARHAMVTKVRGSFTEFDGSGYFDTEHPENSRL